MLNDVVDSLHANDKKKLYGLVVNGWSKPPAHELSIPRPWCNLTSNEVVYLHLEFWRLMVGPDPVRFWKLLLLAKIHPLVALGHNMSSTLRITSSFFNNLKSLFPETSGRGLVIGSASSS
jgi:hypothetical protein